MTAPTPAPLRRFNWPKLWRRLRRLPALVWRMVLAVPVYLLFVPLAGLTLTWADWIKEYSNDEPFGSF